MLGDDDEEVDEEEDCEWYIPQEQTIAQTVIWLSRQYHRPKVRHSSSCDQRGSPGWDPPDIDCHGAQSSTPEVDREHPP